MTTKEFEEFIHNELKLIYEKYSEIYKGDKPYLSMFVAKNEDTGEIYYSANNNHWEEGVNVKVDRFWREGNEQD